MRESPGRGGGTGREGKGEEESKRELEGEVLNE